MGPNQRAANQSNERGKIALVTMNTRTAKANERLDIERVCERRGYDNKQGKKKTPLYQRVKRRLLFYVVFSHNNRSVIAIFGTVARFCGSETIQQKSTRVRRRKWRMS